MTTMELVMIRTAYDDHQSTGILHVLDGRTIEFTCYTLELPWRNNMRGISCVPPGTYRIVKEYSPKFKQMLWELKGVPGRDECKFHTANYVHQLNGCIAPGRSYADINGDGIIDITNSRKTLEALHDTLAGIDETIITIYGQP